MMKSIRIGGKLRRIRQDKHLSQVQMAQELDISPSYLNLLESNQRPVTVRVLLTLAERFQIDISELASESDARLSTDLMEAFSDPFFDDHDVKATDIKEMVTSLPALSKAVLELYKNYRRSPPGAGNMDDEANDTTPPGIPSEEVNEFLQRRLNHFPELEKAAESLWINHGFALHTLAQDLARLLNQTYAVDVDIVSAQQLGGMLRSYNPLTRKLMLSEMMPIPSRTFQLAYQIGFLAFRREIEIGASGGKFTTPEADALARSALANYFAGALMAPYERFLATARETRYDLTILRRRFGLSFEQVCHRLTTLQRPGSEGIPFHLIRVDIAGNISKRFSASGIHIARFGAACPRWNVYDAFATPGMLRVQVSRMPDGAQFFCVAQTVTPAGRATMRGGLPQRVGMLSLGLGCTLGHAREIVYSDGLSLDDPQIVTPIGVSCRTCPRDDCTDRAMPSIHQKLEIDENRRGLSTYVRPR